MTKEHIIELVLVAAVALGAAYFVFTKPVAAPAILSPMPSGQTVPTEDTSDWKLYRNDQYGFEFRYPNDWSVDDQSKNHLSGFYLEFYPPDAEPMVGYFSILVDTRTDLNQIRNLYINNGYTEVVGSLGGKTAYIFIQNERAVYYIPIYGKILNLAANEQRPEGNKILSSFRFDLAPEGLEFNKSDSTWDYYSGSVVVTGDYSIGNEGILSNTLSFKVDSSDQNEIPRKEGDNRLAWFNFSNESYALAELGFKNPDPSICNSWNYTGRATISIADYMVLRIATAGGDRAKLLSVVSNSDPLLECH